MYVDHEYQISQLVQLNTYEYNVNVFGKGLRWVEMG